MVLICTAGLNHLVLRKIHLAVVLPSNNVAEPPQTPLSWLKRFLARDRKASLVKLRCSFVELPWALSGWTLFPHWAR